jgi:hypothetical protein
MKRKGWNPELEVPAAQKLPKAEKALPAASRQLLKKGNRNKRATISPSQPHSKTFGR